MSTVFITNVADLANARNTLRKEVLDREWPPILCVRAVAALTILGELILKMHISGSLQTEITSHKQHKGVEVKGVFPKNAAEDFALLRKQLDRAVNTIAVQHKDNQLHIAIEIHAEV